MRRILRTASLLLVAAASWTALASVVPRLAGRGAFAQDQSGFDIEYRGELLDGERRPLSGVFGVTFQLLHERDAVDALWSETRWVAVSEGMYDLRLGTQSRIPDNLDGRQLWMRILIGGAEVGLHEIAINVPSDGEGEIAPGPFFSERPIVDLAGHAIRADRALRARNCNTLAGQTLAEIDRTSQFESQLADLRRQLREAADGPFVGEQQNNLERIGGETGNPYQVVCPPGYVVTGIRGKGGNVLDSYVPICSQIR